MVTRYTESEYKLAKDTDKLKLECEYCKKEFLCTKKRIQYEITHPQKYNRFCSRTCANKNQIQNVKTICTYCNKDLYRKPAEAKKLHNFCSKSCAAKYNNANIKYTRPGSQRSKLEIWIEQQLKSLYPNLEILFNDRQTINAELDIYIPSLKLAFELNGIFHYEPIFGQDKLDKTINNDNRKFAACIENNISLCIIDTSQQVYIKPHTCEKYLLIINNILNEHLSLS